MWANGNGANGGVNGGAPSSAAANEGVPVSWVHANGGGDPHHQQQAGGGVGRRQHRAESADSAATAAFGGGNAASYARAQRFMRRAASAASPAALEPGVQPSHIIKLPLPPSVNRGAFVLEVDSVPSRLPPSVKLS